MTASNSRELVVGPTLSGERVDRAVAMLLDCSRARAVDLVRDGAVRVNASVTLARAARLAEGDTVTVEVTEREQAIPDFVRVPMVYFDSDLVVIDKPAGLLVHRNQLSDNRASVADSMIYLFPEIARLGSDPLRAGIVHRLDQTTSGAMIVARSEMAYEGLSEQVRAHTMVRRYLAVVVGDLGKEQGEIDAPLARRGGGRAGFGVAAGGRFARTRYKSLAVSPEGRFSLVEVVLETGRTHQIRVHFGAIGHPLVGDGLYGGPIEGGFSRPALHSRELSYMHPRSEIKSLARSELPWDMAQLMSALSLSPANNP